MLVTPFGANGEVEHVVDGLGDVEVDTDFPLPVEAGIERRGRIWIAVVLRLAGSSPEFEEQVEPLRAFRHSPVGRDKTRTHENRRRCCG